MITTLLIVLIAALLPAKIIYRALGPQFGGAFNKEHKKAYTRSKHWDGKVFENLETTTMNIGIKEMPAMLRAFFSDREARTPKQNLPIKPFNNLSWQADNEPKFIWYGHSVLLLKIDQKNFLIDPMLGPDASPIAPFATKRFSKDALSLIDKLPKLDAVLITHDHYDHLDLKSIKALKKKVDTWFVALGVSRHLEAWGVPAQQITEFDWWQSLLVDDLELTFTPSRHFSGRGPFDRAKSLWGGWTFKSTTHNIFWSGDGGYGSHFKEIGERLGPFDWGFIECGQYNERWHAIHMYPEEAIKAAKDAKVKVATPVHWGGFSLALHPWKEPIERFTAEANQQEQQVYTPQLGQQVSVQNPPENTNWWQNIE